MIINYPLNQVPHMETDLMLQHLHMTEIVSLPKCLCFEWHTRSLSSFCFLFLTVSGQHLTLLDCAFPLCLEQGWISKRLLRTLGIILLENSNFILQKIQTWGGQTHVASLYGTDARCNNCIKHRSRVPCRQPYVWWSNK